MNGAFRVRPGHRPIAETLSSAYRQGMSTPRLSRPRQERLIAGVCSGIARRFGWSTTVVRVVTVASILIPGPQVLAYVICWIVLPNDPKTA